MEKTKTMGAAIAALRKEKGMTQQALAEKMGVTDKAVSKWERDLSCPDVGSLPLLAETLGVSLEELMQTGKQKAAPSEIRDTVRLVFRAVAVAMGVAVVALNMMGKLEQSTAFTMLGLGLAALSVASLEEK